MCYNPVTMSKEAVITPWDVLEDDGILVRTVRSAQEHGDLPRQFNGVEVTGRAVTVDVHPGPEVVIALPQSFDVRSGTMISAVFPAAEPGIPFPYAGDQPLTDKQFSHLQSVAAGVQPSRILGIDDLAARTEVGIQRQITNTNRFPTRPSFRNAP